MAGRQQQAGRPARRRSGAGTGATTTTNWTNVDPSFIKYNDYGWVDGGGFGLDYMAASEGFYNNVIRVNYDGAAAPSTNNMDSLFDSGNGTTPAGTPVDMASVNDATACLHKGFEVRIPWTNLYVGTRFGTVEAGETVPRGATLHLLAGIHNNDPASAWSSPDTIPNQTVVDHTNGVLTTADYLGVVVDSDTNGIPDMIAGDANGPYIRSATGAIGSSSVIVGFNEPVTVGTVQNLANWTVGGSAPISAVAQGSQAVLLGLAAPIPATNLVLIRATGVQDVALNSRTTEHCLEPASSGIPQAVAVTFQVNTNSGMGISSSHVKPAAFFVNGSALPLEWGYPPFETVQLTAIPGSNGWAQATVIFPAGSPGQLSYKYSGRIAGTNNYEAIRLVNYADAARPLTLNTNGTPMTVVDYLGAAAHPLRGPGDTNLPPSLNRLYTDAQRGDAGVRVRREILFRLDLSLRKRDNLARVMVMGSDPLRGFNDTGAANDFKAQDFPKPGENLVPWSEAGIQLFDDGTHGDTAADDGVYARLWTLSTDGFDSAIEPGSPNSLVGGVESVFFPEDIPGTQPYDGTGWLTRRSPRSFIYKYFVLTDGGDNSSSPSSDIEYYVADPNETAQIVFPPFIWDNDFLPPPPPSNAPALTAVSHTGTTAYVNFENVPNEGSHGVKISTNLLAGFDDYGYRATAGITNGGVREWTASIAQAPGPMEFYAPYAGLEPTPTPTYWQPNDLIPIGATTVRVYFCQFQSNLRGMRNMNLTGTFSGWNNGLPMAFLGNGLWMIDLALPAAADGSGVSFKPRGGPAFDWLGGGDFQFIRGTGGVTWAPKPPVPGELFTITLDAAGTPLAAATDIRLHMGFDNWKDVQDPRPAMTNLPASTLWEYSFLVGSNYTSSIDWVFTDGTASTWYSAGNWHAFMAPYYSP